MYSGRGVVYVYTISNSGVFSYRYQLKAPVITDNIYFGSGIATVNNTLFVGAPGESSNDGRVFY